MILWFVLFFLIIAISLVLAYQSMKDYVEKPALSSYSLYLVRNPLFTAQLLDEIHSAISPQDGIISFEKLFKGQKSALVVFGPKGILEKFKSQLNLLELEDYTSVDSNQVTAWEMTLKDPKLVPNNLKPDLQESEQFWFSLILQGKKGLLGSLSAQKTEYQKMKEREGQKSDVKSFVTQIRAVLVSFDPARRKVLAENLENMVGGNLVKLPRPFTSAQIFEAYKTRVLQPVGQSLTLTSEELIPLLKV